MKHRSQTQVRIDLADSRPADARLEEQDSEHSLELSSKNLGSRQLRRSPSRLAAHTFDLLLVCALACLLCFVNLDAFSIRDWDESTHVLATQNMYAHGHWFTPQVEGEAYFNKPPLKMWLSALSIQFLGESNFSWRFIDALAGLGTCIVLYFFAFTLFRSRSAALAAPFALLGCAGYLFEHCVRMAVQDSMLVFLSTLALYSGYCTLRKLDTTQTNAWPIGWLLISGFSSGAAILTKNLTGLLPIAVLGAFALTTGRIWQWRTIAALTAIAGIALATAASYMLPHCLYSEGACATFFGFEVWGRVTEGYHNTDNPWLYWEVLLQRERALPTYVLALSFLWACYAAITSHRDAGRLVLIWVLIPLAALSLSASRLPWYIAPLFPGISLAFAGLISWTLHLKTHRQTRWRMIAALVFLGSVLGVAQHVERNTRSVFNDKERIAIDELASLIREVPSHAPSSVGMPFQIATYEMPIPAWRELPYLRSFVPFGQAPLSFAALEDTLQRKEPLLLLTAREHLDAIFQLAIPSGYFELPRFAERSRSSIALLFHQPDTPELFQANKILLDFGSRDLTTAFGWEHPGTFGNLGIRHSTASRSGLLLEADWLFAERPLELYLNIALRSKTPTERTLRVYINDRFITTFRLRDNNLKTLQAPVPAGTLALGTNILTFHTDDETSIMANWLSLQLR